MDEEIRTWRADRVAVIELNRPAKLNALTPAMRRRMLAEYEAIERDDAVVAVVLCAAGERAFCAGADLSELGQRTLRSELGPDARLRRVLPRFIEQLGKPTIAALHGFVLGAGLELALACTLRIASPDAQFGLPELRHGVIPGSGGTQRLTRLVGQGWAQDLILTQRRIDAALALQIGLITRLVERDLRDEAIALGNSFAQVDPLALRMAKTATARAFVRDLDDDIEAERHLFALCLAAKNQAETP